MIFCVFQIDFFSALTSIGTLATAIVTGLMVWEIKKQRKNSYQPHLYIDKVNFFVQSNQNELYFMATTWHDNPKSAAEPADFQPNSTTYNAFFLKCYNIGFGTAKKTIIKVFYDVDEFISQIKRLEKNVLEDLRFDIVNGDNLLTILPKNNKLPYKGSGLGSKFGVDESPIYILPANINQSFTPIRLPLSFLELLNVYVFYWANITPMKDMSEYIPSLKVEISYSDISNKNETRIFNITTQIGIFGTMTYNGQFIPVEIN